MYKLKKVICINLFTLNIISKNVLMAVIILSANNIIYVMLLFL